MDRLNRNISEIVSQTFGMVFEYSQRFDHNKSVCRKSLLGCRSTAIYAISLSVVRLFFFIPVRFVLGQAGTQNAQREQNTKHSQQKLKEQ